MKRDIVATPQYQPLKAKETETNALDRSLIIIK